MPRFKKILGFTVLQAENPALVTDGKIVIEINPDRYARAGVKLLKKSWNETAAALAAYTAVLEIDDGYLLSDPSGVWIYLQLAREGLDFAPAEAPISKLGNFAGLSLETTYMVRSADIWELLGFEVKHGSRDGEFLSLENGDGLGVSLMAPNCCPHLFFNPSLTYFNGKNNLDVIAQIREADIPIAEEITLFNKEGLVDNIIFRDPGGYGIFVFND